MKEVLIIDDMEDLRDLVEVILEEEEIEVLDAEDGESALELLERGIPDLILLDVNMPGMDGWETLEEMEKRGLTEDSFVIMFTVEELTFVDMLRKDVEGLVGYVEKPFDKEELVNLVENYLDITEEIRGSSGKIEESPDGGKDMAEAYKAWSRSKLVHELFLEKLKEMEEKVDDEKMLERVENMKEGEENAIESLARKKEEIVRMAGLESRNVS